MAWQDVKDLFKPYGPEFVDVKRGPDGRSMGVAIVRFGTTEGTERSIRAYKPCKPGRIPAFLTPAPAQRR